MADFRSFNMAAAAVLDFGNFKCLTVVTLKRVELRLRVKFCRTRSNRGWDMAIFQFFKMAAVRQLGFSKVGNFNFRSHSEAQYASPYQNFAKIGQTIPEIWPIFDFSRWRTPPLDFGNLKFLTVGTVKRLELRLPAKCCRNRSNRGWDMAIFQLFKMAAVRHLGFSKVGNFNFQSHSEAQYASPY